jgi:hypothetical protein
VEIYPWCNGAFAEVLEISGRPILNAVLLNWNSRFEIRVIDYEIQRAGSDGVFQPLAKVTAQNKSVLNEYEWKDLNPLKEKAKYRLKINNDRGAFAYSDEVIVPYLPSGEPATYPNPFHDLLHVTIPAQGGIVRFELFDLNGASVLEKSWFGQALVDEEVSLGGLRPGMYLYTIFDGGRAWYGRVIKLD